MLEVGLEQNEDQLQSTMKRRRFFKNRKNTSGSKLLMTHYDTSYVNSTKVHVC